MKTGRIVKTPPHAGGNGRWVECYPSLSELKDFNMIPLGDRTYCPTDADGHTKQSPRLVRLSVAREKGWVG